VITYYGAMGLAQFSVDHLPGPDWINERNTDAQKVSDLVAVYPFTAGALPYADSTGKLTESTSELLWDETSKILRVGTTAAGAAAIGQTVPGLALSIGALDTTLKYGMGLKFVSSDPQFTTRNPKFLAGIVPRATEAYSADDKGGMALDFFFSPNAPGADPIPTRGFTLDENGVSLDATIPLVINSSSGLSSPRVQGSTLILTSSPSTLVIASGVITVTSSYHRVDTEGATSTDNLDTINGGVEGQLLILRTVDSARDVILQDNSASLFLAGNCTLTTVSATITLLCVAANTWIEIGRSIN
jgi:hypothetical protein